MPRAPLLAGIAAIVAVATAPAAGSRAAVSHAREPGVTRTSVTVGGVLADDPTMAGADLGARARFARTRRVAGRAVHYVGTSHENDTAAVTRLTTDAFAVVPVIGGNAVPTITQAHRPFVGLATSPGWRANPSGFGITGSPVGAHGREPNPVWGRQLRALLGNAPNQTVAIVTNDAAAVPAASRHVPRPARLQDAGFSVATPIVVPEPAAGTDVASVAAALTAQNPAVVLVPTSTP